MQRGWLLALGGAVVAGGLLVAALTAPVLAQGGPGQGPRGGAGFGPRGEVAGALQPVSDLLGLTPDALRAELRAGRSLADIAAARGVDQTTLTATITTAARGRLDAAVADGRLSQERADALFQRLQQNVGQWIAATPPSGGSARQGGPRGFAGGFLGGPLWGAPEAVANRLGMTPEELRAERRAGRSLADIAASRGVDQATLLGIVTDAARTRLDAAVAAGRLNQQQANALLGVVQAFAPDMITRTGPPQLGRADGPQQGRGPRRDGVRRGPGAPPAEQAPAQ